MFESVSPALFAWMAGVVLVAGLSQGALGFAQSSRTVKRLLMQRALGVAGEVPAPVRRLPS